MEKLKNVLQQDDGHMLPDCTRPWRPYSAVSVSLQEVTLVEDSEENEPEKV